MVYVTVSGTPVPGKEEEALKFAVKLADYVNENYSNQVEMCRSVTGPLNRYVWVEKCESLASYDENVRKQELDDERNAIMNEGAGLWTDMERHIVEVI